MEQIKIKKTKNYHYVFANGVKMATVSFITGNVWGATKYFKYLNIKTKVEQIENKVVEKQSSVELKKGAKGVYSWNIKVYFNEANPANEVKKIDDELKKRYGGE